MTDDPLPDRRSETSSDGRKPWRKPAVIVSDPSKAELTLSNVSTDGILFS